MIPKVSRFKFTLFVFVSSSLFSISCIVSFLTVRPFSLFPFLSYEATESSHWSYPLARFFVFFMALAVARTWLPYRDYSQEILLLTGVLTLVNRSIESLVDGIDFDTIPITIICKLCCYLYLIHLSLSSHPLRDYLPQNSLSFHSRVCLRHFRDNLDPSYHTTHVRGWWRLRVRCACWSIRLHDLGTLIDRFSLLSLIVHSCSLCGGHTSKNSWHGQNLWIYLL